MSDHPRGYEAHLFICTNKKERGECCADKGGMELRNQVKRLASSRKEWKGRVRVNASGCLDQCERGIAAVIYPQGKWMTGLTEDSAAELVRELEEILDQDE